MRALKKPLQVLFGLAHLAIIPITICVFFIEGFVLEEALLYVPMGFPLLLSLLILAFTMPHQIFLLLALPIPVILPAIGCFTLGRKKSFYFLFVVIPHIINTALVCLIFAEDPIVMLLNIGYLAVAILLAALPD